MKNKPALSLLALLAASTGFAQNGPAEIRNMTKLSFLSPGIIYEARTGPFQSLRGHAFLGLGFSFSYSSSLGSDFEMEANPGLGLQYRFYYNGKARAAAGKRTENNNQNYVAGFSQMLLSKARMTDSGNEVQPANLRPVTSLGVVWGIQRNYPKHFSLDLNLGPGIYFTRAEYDYGGVSHVKETISNFTILGELTLGFWLNARKKN